MDNQEDILKELNQIEKEEVKEAEQNEVSEKEPEENTSEQNKNTSNEAPKKIEVVTGNGDLTISPVYEHLEVEKPKPKENRKIFIPEVKGDAKPKEEKSNDNDNTEKEDN